MRQAPNDLSAARFGDSDGAAVGEWVLAVGSPLGLDQTITAGIISGRPESMSTGSGAPPRRRYLLTDANLSPGDSGGPLVDLDGEVVGLTTAISAGPGGSYGYAVPINRVRRVGRCPAQGGARRSIRTSASGSATCAISTPASGAVWGWGRCRCEGALVSRVWRGRRPRAPACAQGTSSPRSTTRAVPAPGGAGRAHLPSRRLGRTSSSGSFATGTIVASRSPSATCRGRTIAPDDRLGFQAAGPATDQAGASPGRPLRSRISVISAGAPRRMGGPQ